MYLVQWFRLGAPVTAEAPDHASAVAAAHEAIRAGAWAVTIRGPGGSEVIYEIRFTRIHIDRSGYAPGGRYFGTGAPVWYVDGPDEYIRAANRAAALRIVAARWPNSLIVRG